MNVQTNEKKVSKKLGKLSPRQQAIQQAIANYGQSGRAVVVQFELALCEYWNISHDTGKESQGDSCNPNNLLFFVNCLAKSKHYNPLFRAAKLLLQKFTPLYLKPGKGKHNLMVDQAKTGKPSKEEKEVYRREVYKFVMEKNRSLLTQKDIKTEVSYDWAKNKGTLRAKINKAIADDLTHADEIIGMVMAAKADVIAKQLANADDMSNNVVQIGDGSKDSSTQVA